MLRRSRVVNDRVHRSDRVHLIGELPGLAQIGEVTDDGGGPACHQILHRPEPGLAADQQCRQHI